MTLSFALIAALFLLAPGLAGYAGLFVGSRTRTFHPAPPAPGSMLALGIVTIGAILFHALAATAFWLHDRLVGDGPGLIEIAGPANLYLVALDGWRARDVAGGSGGATVARLFLGLCALNTAAFLSVTRLARLSAARTWLDPMLYGWLAELVRDTRVGLRYVYVFVLTGIEHDGVTLGYEGTLDSLSLTSDKEITTVLLVDCRRFNLRLTSDGAKRTEVAGEDRIARLHISREDIRNIAFEIYEVAEA